MTDASRADGDNDSSEDVRASSKSELTQEKADAAVKAPPAESPGRMVEVPEDVSHVVFALYGFQARRPEAAKQYMDQLRRLFAETQGPNQVERAHYIDSDGYHCDVLMAYWIGREEFKKWSDTASVVMWWAGLPADPASDVGFWREVMCTPKERFQHSTFIDKKAAIALLLPLVRSPHFGYTGSGRDRYAASKYDDFETPYADVPDAVVRASKGKRIRISIPDNIYFTREGQNWDSAVEADRAMWRESMEPVIGQWVEALQHEPKTTGSLSMRPCREQDLESGAEIERQSQFGFVISRRHIEHAARTHPTHLSLLKSWRAFSNDVAERARSGGIDSWVHIWVEGHILKKDELDAQYVNCHPRTGLLPYFVATEVAPDVSLCFE
ncbi:phenylacetaldoxime dehydratase family protein [Paraburkholderia terrae]|uniref:Phenylacetaldoxime dehydratase n=1 Tax=Paraburkholderia terrae TaxID=311230 RepID=A0A2I8EZN7_9BURK|nr:phenylacetaldoxime dehydratase family protein [Paraburkholderia terrae]AUT65056.1 hypothetical protein C2L65_36345 [Paraburkholderia terrae]